MSYLPRVIACLCTIDIEMEISVYLHNLILETPDFAVPAILSVSVTLQRLNIKNIRNENIAHKYHKTIYYMKHDNLYVTIFGIIYNKIKNYTFYCS